MGRAVFCIVDSERQAQRVVVALRLDGFAESDISVLFPDKFGERDLGYKRASKAPEGATAGFTTGGVLGGAAGWLASTGVLSLPGLGAFVSAGPIMGALAGVAVGATAGGLAGAVIGLGLPEFEAKQYVNKIRGGNILISVHTEDDDEDARVRAKQTFERYHAHDIASGPEEVV